MAKDYEYDVVVIGLGPAGMAVAAMASEMGLRVCAVESNKIGGECMNVGCIPSKALVRISEYRHMISKLPDMELESLPLPQALNPFKKIASYLKYINQNKTKKMFDKTKLVLGEGKARFLDAHTIIVGKERIFGKYIYIATGTEPALPSIPGINDVDILTNTNLFNLEKIPASLTIIGGGAIGCEMAQAFNRLGSCVSIVHSADHLLPIGDFQAAALLEQKFIDEGIQIFNGRKILKLTKNLTGVELETEDGEKIVSEKILVAAGRKIDLSSLDLDRAGVIYGKKGIEVDKYLRTNIKNIYAIGDCNGYAQLSHAAMHQGMIAIINTLLPWILKQDFRKFQVPWTVFTDPEVSHVGKTEKQLIDEQISHEIIEVRYEDYGAAIAENTTTGFVKVFASKFGHIYGATIVGKGSGEMINEWALAIQQKVPLYKIMLQQHSFPTMGFLSKRIAENWMLKRMNSKWVKKIISWLIKL